MVSPPSCSPRRAQAHSQPRPDPTPAAVRAGHRTATIVPGRYVCSVHLTWSYGRSNELTIGETESCRYVRKTHRGVKIVGTALLLNLRKGAIPS